ncbi:MAG TPA: amidohydrolase family protein [Candidatus Sulfotelmatobacter sp.]|nr:amidohydrolase family protein [Candidatus Sulfotelmatobacter sp.]
MLDLLIRGGTVIDGSGADRHTADVGISGGRVAAIGRVTEAARHTIDADGLIVAPGFIDGHTHLDAQVMWDPLGTSSCYNGVTSVVMSNCGFTLAPCKPGDRDWYANCLSYVEDIPAAAMAAGMEWTWESFAEYLAAVERRPKGLNYAMYVGHSALRMYVMGRRALTDEATDAEIGAMARLAQDALRAGAIGVSTSRAHTHLTPDGMPVASRQASWRELETIVAAMAELGTGIFQIGSDILNHGTNVAMLERLEHLTLTYKRTMMFGLLSTRQGDDPVSWQTQAKAIEDANRAGGRMFGQVSTRSINAIYSLKSYLPFDVLPEWQAVRAHPLPEQLQMLRDPARRRALVAAEQRMKPKDNKLQGGGAATIDPRKPDYDQLFALKGMDWDDPTVAELSRARGMHPVETMIELSLENPDQIYVWPLVNEDREGLLGMLKHDFALATFSDAGAHSAQEMGACLQTHFLNYWVNRRGAFTMEQAVRKMTHDIAEAFELKDRGLVAPGYKADLVLFEADRVRPCLPKIETDLPGGARRLVQKADGIRATIVNGALTMENGESTGNFAGEVMKGALG